ncbi:oxidoreductase, partial [Staphylococcus aureus]
MTDKFKAYVVDRDDEGKVSADFKQITIDDLPEGDVL